MDIFLDGNWQSGTETANVSNNLDQASGQLPQEFENQFNDNHSSLNDSYRVQSRRDSEEFDLLDDKYQRPTCQFLELLDIQNQVGVYKLEIISGHF